MFQPSARKRAEITAQDVATVAREGGQKTLQHQPQAETLERRKRVVRVAVDGKNPRPKVRAARVTEGLWVKNSLKSLKSPRWWRSPREVWEWKVSRLPRYLLIGPKLLPRVPANQALKKNLNPLRGLLQLPSPPLQINARPRHPPRLSWSLASLLTRTLHRQTRREMTASRPHLRHPSTQRVSGLLCVCFLQWRRKSFCPRSVTLKSVTLQGRHRSRFC